MGRYSGLVKSGSQSIETICEIATCEDDSTNSTSRSSIIDLVNEPGLLQILIKQVYLGPKFPRYKTPKINLEVLSSLVALAQPDICKVSLYNNDSLLKQIIRIIENDKGKGREMACLFICNLSAAKENRERIPTNKQLIEVISGILKEVLKEDGEDCGDSKTVVQYVFEIFRNLTVSDKEKGKKGRKPSKIRTYSSRSSSSSSTLGSDHNNIKFCMQFLPDVIATIRKCKSSDVHIEYGFQFIQNLATSADLQSLYILYNDEALMSLLLNNL